MAVCFIYYSIRNIKEMKYKGTKDTVWECFRGYAGMSNVQNMLQLIFKDVILFLV